MLEGIQSKVRRGARRAVFSVLVWVCAAVGAGFASFAGFAGLREAGLSPALAGLILASVWFGFAGVCLIAREVIADVGQVGQKAHGGADPEMHRNAQTPPLAEAFSAGLAEGAAFASRHKAK